MPAPPNAPSDAVTLKLAGLGTVGKAVIEILSTARDRLRRELGRDLVITAVLDRSYRRKDLSLLAPETRVTDSLETFLEVPADLVVELIGGCETALRIVTESLGRGRSVITANKLLLAQYGLEIIELARRHNASLGFEAAVAGGIPIVRVLQSSLVPDCVEEIRGILNGTCNYVLSRMERENQPLSQALREAQEAGFAEADPQLDLSGRDTADKLVLLTLLAFRQWIPINDVPISGITGIDPVDFLYARRLGATIRLLGISRRCGDGVRLRVSPFLIPLGSSLSDITGATNGVEIRSHHLGSLVLSGPGAGGGPTAVSVVADILQAARGLLPPVSLVSPKEVSTRPPDEDRRRFYLRFIVRDQPGIIAALAGVLARYEISIDSVLQEPWPEGSRLPFVITVESTAPGPLAEALREMAAFEFNIAPPVSVPWLEDSISSRGC